MVARQSNKRMTPATCHQMELPAPGQTSESTSDVEEANLGGNATLADRGIAALIRAAATVGPRGKQASYASRACASYILVERGDASPRTLAAAFLKAMKGEDILNESSGAGAGGTAQGLRRGLW